MYFNLQVISTEAVTTWSTKQTTPKNKKKAVVKKKLTPTKKKLATKKKLWRPFHVMLLYFDRHNTFYACVLPPVMLLCGPRTYHCIFKTYHVIVFSEPIIVFSELYFQDLSLYFQNHVRMSDSVWEHVKFIGSHISNWSWY